MEFNIFVEFICILLATALGYYIGYNRGSYKCFDDFLDMLILLEEGLRGVKENGIKDIKVRVDVEESFAELTMRK